MAANRIRVKSGRLVDPFDLTPEDIASMDFPHAVCNINRYTGWSKYPYSVGQHSLILAKHVPIRLRRAALIHDFAETMFNDLASPVKKKYRTYKRDEKAALRPIAEYLGVPWEEIEEVSPYDKRMYRNEMNVLFDVIEDDGEGMGDDRKPLDIHPHLFRERHWEDVLSEFNTWYAFDFPDHYLTLRKGG